MAKQVQRRRGTTVQHATFTGAQGEITYDTDKKKPVCHDGATAGGFELARQSDLASAIPPGIIMDYGGSSAPSGWLLCYGQAINRNTYAALFAVIGTAFGSGDGSTTFNLPDARGRVSAGKDDMGGASANRLTNQSGGLNGDVLGATGGLETHTLTAAQMPSHTHSVNEPVGQVLPAGPGVGAAGPVSATTTGSAGSGGAHNNVQPTIIFNKIIKT